MILTCPACGTQYAVKDGSIPEDGRKVRCAACGHSWHQPGSADVQAPDEEAAPEEAAPVAEAAPAPAVPEDQVAGSPGYEATEPVAPDAGLAEPPLAVPVAPDDGWPEPPGDEQDWEPEKEIPDAEEIAAAERETGADRKRNWLMGVLIAVVVVVAVVAALWLLAPDSIRQRIGLAAAGPTPLQIAPGPPERQKLASGNELVVVSGRVINPSSKEQAVPPIEAQLHDSSGRLIYSWTIAPPARTLPPGGSASFNSAEMDVPPSGLDSTVTLTLKG